MDFYEIMLQQKLAGGGGGGDVSVESLSVTENGTYTASSGHAYSPVTVSVPQSGITPTGTSNITANGIYDVTNFASASVSVPTGVFPSGTSSITANGIYDITNFASVDVNVSGGGGGGHDAEDAIIEGTISGAYTNNRVLNIKGSRFTGCTQLTDISFANLIEIGTSAFMYCSSIKTAYLPKVNNIWGGVFYGCNILMSVYLLGSSVAMLSSPGAFGNTPISKSTYTGSFGSIYVPASLVDSYKTAANWSVYADRITAYEG